MAEKNIAALLDSMAYTIRVAYQHSSDQQTYTYVCNLPEISTGDFVVVPTTDKSVKYTGQPYDTQDMISPVLVRQASTLLRGQRLTIASVVQIDQQVDIESSADIEYKWVVAKVDLTAYTKLIERNKEISLAVQEAYKRNLRRSFADRVLGELAEDEKTKLLGLLNK